MQVMQVMQVMRLMQVMQLMQLMQVMQVMQVMQLMRRLRLIVPAFVPLPRPLSLQFHDPEDLTVADSSGGSQRPIMEVAAMKKNGRPVAPRALHAQFWEGVRLRGWGGGGCCGGRPGEGTDIVLCTCSACITSPGRRAGR
jgi:hypothetical protein